VLLLLLLLLLLLYIDPVLLQEEIVGIFTCFVEFSHISDWSKDYNQSARNSQLTYHSILEEHSRLQVWHISQYCFCVSIYCYNIVSSGNWETLHCIQPGILLHISRSLWRFDTLFRLWFWNPRNSNWDHHSLYHWRNNIYLDLKCKGKVLSIMTLRKCRVVHARYATVQYILIRALWTHGTGRFCQEPTALRFRCSSLTNWLEVQLDR
jgi:hypothetical protein